MKNLTELNLKLKQLTLENKKFKLEQQKQNFEEFKFKEELEIKKIEESIKLIYSLGYLLYLPRIDDSKSIIGGSDVYKCALSDEDVYEIKHKLQKLVNLI